MEIIAKCISTVSAGNGSFWQQMSHKNIIHSSVKTYVIKEKDLEAAY